MASPIWQDTFGGAAQGAGTGLVVSGGNPFAAIAGGLVGGVTGYLGSRTRQKKQKREIKFQKAKARAHIAQQESALADFEEAAGYQRQNLYARGVADSTIAQRLKQKQARHRNIYHKNIHLGYQGYQLARKGQLAEQRLGYINLLDQGLQSLAVGLTGYFSGGGGAQQSSGGTTLSYSYPQGAAQPYNSPY